jgi:hypothetical protein
VRAFCQTVRGFVWNGERDWGDWRVLVYLFLVVKALVVVFQHGHAFRFAAVIARGGVGDVAGEDFLPEGEAAGGAWRSGG